MPTKKPASELDQKLIRRLVFKKASENSIDRGLSYAQHGYVSRVRVKDGAVKGVVQGTRDYHVRLALSGGSLEYKCSCPYFVDSGACCKHCVATIIALDGGHQTFQEEEDLQREFLLAMGHDELVDWVLEEVDANPHLAANLQFAAGRRVPAGKREEYYRGLVQGAFIGMRRSDDEGILALASALITLEKEDHALAELVGLECAEGLCEMIAEYGVDVAEWPWSQMEGALCDLVPGYEEMVERAYGG